jgi:hypothetical protein
MRVQDSRFTLCALHATISRADGRGGTLAPTTASEKRGQATFRRVNLRNLECRDVSRDLLRSTQCGSSCLPWLSRWF